MRILWCGWLLVVLVGTLLPANSAPLVELGKLSLSDKTEHFVAYFGLATLLPFVQVRRMWLWCLVLVALGFALEGAQALAPGRSPDLWDGVADTIGVLVGAGLGLAVRAMLAAFLRTRSSSDPTA